MNILIVDDEKDELETLRRGLRIKGYEISEALSPENALRILEKNQNAITLVITDYLMPNMNGIDFLKAIRERYGSLPVIMVSAYGSSQVLTEAIQNGCNGFLEKPFTLDQLNREIIRVTCG